jgi:hypothetical protein
MSYFSAYYETRVGEMGSGQRMHRRNGKCIKYLSKILMGRDHQVHLSGNGTG